VDRDKPNAIFTLNTKNDVPTGPKQLRRLRPFAGGKTGALILLLSRVTAAQGDMCVITVILNDEQLSISDIAGIRHNKCPLF
jgi:hypothetical protein